MCNKCYLFSVLFFVLFCCSFADYVDKCYESFEFGKGISAVFEILDEVCNVLYS